MFKNKQLSSNSLHWTKLVNTKKWVSLLKTRQADTFLYFCCFSISFSFLSKSGTKKLSFFAKIKLVVHSWLIIYFLLTRLPTRLHSRFLKNALQCCLVTKRLTIKILGPTIYMRLKHNFLKAARSCFFTSFNNVYQ